jgi:hypothetical protein
MLRVQALRQAAVLLEIGSGDPALAWLERACAPI